MSQGKLLIIDDEEIIIEGFKIKLETAGYEVKTALSGKEAIELAEGENFDIVYVDLVIPDMSGVEICGRIKKISPRTQIILITGLPADVIHEFRVTDEVLESEINAFLQTHNYPPLLQWRSYGNGDYEYHQYDKMWGYIEIR